MTAVPPNQSNVYQALRAFLLQVLPSGIEIVQGQDNRVPEPPVTDFVVMTVIRRERLSTNVDVYADASFSGLINAAVLTVTSVNFGSLTQGSPLYGANVTSGTTIGAQIDGTPGGVGDYAVSVAQSIPRPEAMASGTLTMRQPTQVTVQLDVHGPASSDNAQTITTAFRDLYATDFFSGLGMFFPGGVGFDVSPAHADDPVQRPFINAENQFETRWVVDVRLLANQVVVVPQQFAAQLTLAGNLIPADIVYPVSVPPPIPPQVPPPPFIQADWPLPRVAYLDRTWFPPNNPNV